MNKPIVIIGGGLAGCEAAWQLTKRGHEVELREMKPAKLSPAHRIAASCRACLQQFAAIQ